MAFGYWHVKVVEENGAFRVLWHPREDEETFHALNKVCDSDVEAGVYADKLRAVIHSGDIDPSDRDEVVSALKRALRGTFRMKAADIGKPKFRVRAA